MSLEIEKMTAMQEKMTMEEAKEVSEIIATLSRDFETILKDSRNYMLTGERTVRPLEESQEALHKLKAYGDVYGIEFPEIHDNKEAGIYILKFGKEIVKGK